jgi:hypothetical protein
MDFNFGFSSKGGSGGSGFTSTNAYTGTRNLIVGDNTISTPMTYKPKFISIFDSLGNDITWSLGGGRSVLNGSTYDIVISSGTIFNNAVVNAYGA